MRRLFPRCLCQPLVQFGYFVPGRPSFVSLGVSRGTPGPRRRKSVNDANVIAGEDGKKRGKTANDAVQSLLGWDPARPCGDAEPFLRKWTCRQKGKRTPICQVIRCPQHYYAWRRENGYHIPRHH
eukprot:EG_transcript_27014